MKHCCGHRQRRLRRRQRPFDRLRQFLRASPGPVQAGIGCALLLLGLLLLLTDLAQADVDVYKQCYNKKTYKWEPCPREGRILKVPAEPEIPTNVTYCWEESEDSWLDCSQGNYNGARLSVSTKNYWRPITLNYPWRLQEMPNWREVKEKDYVHYPFLQGNPRVIVVQHTIYQDRGFTPEDFQVIVPKGYYNAYLYEQSNGTFFNKEEDDYFHSFDEEDEDFPDYEVDEEEDPDDLPVPHERVLWPAAEDSLSDPNQPGSHLVHHHYNGSHRVKRSSAIRMPLPPPDKPGDQYWINGYNCSKQGTLVGSVALNGPAECDRNQADFTAPIPIRIQVVQGRKDQNVVAHRCKLTTVRYWTRCSSLSYTYGGGISEPETMQDVTPGQCRSAFKKGYLIFDGQRIPVTKGAVRNFVYYSHGDVDNDGTCHYGNFKRGNETYEYSYEQTSLRLATDTIRGKVEAGSSNIRFANGLEAPYADGIIKDAYEGIIVWDRKEGNCSSDMAWVYEGRGRLRAPKEAVSNYSELLLAAEAISPGHLRPDLLQGSVVIIREPEQRRYAGFALREPAVVCGHSCYTTSLPDIYACLLRPGETGPIQPQGFHLGINAELANIYSQLGYLHFRTVFEMQSRFENILEHICELSKEAIRGRLRDLSGSENPYALLDLYGPGHEFRKAGAAAYVAKCPVTRVRVRSAPNCTQDIPIEAEDGTHLYMDPFSFVLREFSPAEPCSPVAPPKFFLYGDWWCARPDITACDPPKRLQPNVTAKSYSLSAFTEGHGYGIYTEEQIQQHRLSTRVFSARAATLAALGFAAALNAVAGGDPGFPLLPGDVDRIVRDVGNRLFFLFPFVGESVNYFVGFMVIFSLVTYLLGCLWRLFLLIRYRGWGFWLFAALWDVAFGAVQQPVAWVMAFRAVLNGQQWEALRRHLPPLADAERRNPKYWNRRFPPGDDNNDGGNGGQASSIRRPPADSYHDYKDLIDHDRPTADTSSDEFHDLFGGHPGRQPIFRGPGKLSPSETRGARPKRGSSADAYEHSIRTGQVLHSDTVDPYNPGELVRNGVVRYPSLTSLRHGLRHLLGRRRPHQEYKAPPEAGPSAPVTNADGCCQPTGQIPGDGQAHQNTDAAALSLQLEGVLDPRLGPPEAADQGGAATSALASEQQSSGPANTNIIVRPT